MSRSGVASIMYEQKTMKYRYFLLICIVFLAIIVNLGFFPIISFNSEHPVNLGAFKLVIIAMAIIFCVYLGTFEAFFFPKWSIICIFLFNTAISLCGLFCRYTLEYGEVSNTYNFTLPNVFFQLILFSCIATLSNYRKRRTH